MKAIILAAGVGKRIGAATGNRPKCLLEFGGRSLLVRYLDALLAVGVKSAVLVVGHRQELIRDAVGESYRGLAIRYVVMISTTGAVSIRCGLLAGASKTI